eukprot:10403874-Alexandrium_andersonii.AAC.1
MSTTLIWLLLPRLPAAFSPPTCFMMGRALPIRIWAGGDKRVAEGHRGMEEPESCGGRTAVRRTAGGKRCNPTMMSDA